MIKFTETISVSIALMKVVSPGDKLPKLRIPDIERQSYAMSDRLCGLVVRVLGYRSGGPGSIPGTTRKKKINSGSGTGSTQPREYN
jgi:hypothetical protein